MTYRACARHLFEEGSTKGPGYVGYELHRKFVPKLGSEALCVLELIKIFIKDEHSGIIEKTVA